MTFYPNIKALIRELLSAYAVVATVVLELLMSLVGAVGIPVKAGESKGAFKSKSASVAKNSSSLIVAAEFKRFCGGKI